MATLNKIFTSIILLLLLVGCGEKWVTQLPGGYQLSFFEREKHVYLITNADNEPWIPLGIIGIAISGEYIVGQLEKAEPPSGFEDEPQEWSAPGYFWLNYKSGEKKTRLSKGEWLTSLRSFGITSEPKLVPPKQLRIR